MFRQKAHDIRKNYRQADGCPYMGGSGTPGKPARLYGLGD
jgi:hypothetical protein